MNRKNDLLKIAAGAREASRQLARTDTNLKNRALLKMAEGLEKETRKILAASETHTRAMPSRIPLSRTSIDVGVI